jgi:amidohydrolase
MDNKLKQAIQDVLPEITDFRRELHRNPELSWQEQRTSGRVRDLLSAMHNLRLLPPLIETDVVALLNGDKPGPCIAIRADMDALPITEETGLGYASTTPGVMHACGHDGHTAVLMGAVKVLAKLADSLPGKVKFIFQPAEEEGGGGGVLCERGVLDSPKVDAAIALHAWPVEPVGRIAVRSGPAAGANLEFEIVVKGRGAHGAYPHHGIDPIVIAAHIVTGLQTIVSRTVDAQDAAVVTIGQINGGSATNVVPLTCTLKGTARFVRPDTGARLKQQIRQVAEQTAKAHGGEADVDIQESYPPVYNDPGLAKLVVETGREILGETNVVTDLPISMGVEDFAFYSQQIPTVMFRLGVRPPEKDSYPNLHHPAFDFNDDAIPIGIRMFCELTIRLLSHSAK